jgi:hypothetical protein
MIRLIDNHDLEALPSCLVNLLRLSDFLQQVLHHETIRGADIRRRDLEVIDGCDDVELELSVRGCLEDT